MKKTSTLVLLLVIALAIPLTVLTLQQQQDNRSKASTAKANVDVQPGGSINSAIGSAGAGGTVNVAAGTYNETLDISASDVTVQATGGRVITNGTMKISGKNVKVIGITVKGSGSFGAQVNGADGLLLKDFEIDGSQDGGVIISGSKNVVLDGCNIHGTNAKGLSADGEAVSITGGSTGFEVKNSQVHDNGEEGIDAKYNGAGDVNGTIHDNMVFGNRGPNIYVDGSSGVKIYNNTSHGTTEGSKAGIMIAAETSYGGSENPKHAGNIDIFNNVIYGNAGGGITFWVEPGGSLSDIRVYNNTVDESKPLNVDTAPGGTNPVFNNIFTSSPNGGGIQLGNNLTSNPGFVGNGDYHLTAGSAAIDKGTATGAPAFDHDNKARPAGAGFDMGAYEFGATGGGSTNPTVAPTLLVPTYSCISGVPCTSPGPTQDPNITSAPITPGGSETNPTTSPNNPEPTTTQPCQSTNSVVTATSRKKHKKYRGGGGGFLQQFMQFIMKFIMYLLERLGIQVPNIPTPTDPGNGNPCPQPTTAVEPTTGVQPTTGVEPTIDPGVTVAPTPAGQQNSINTLPSQVLTLTNWKLQLPSGQAESPTEIKQPALATYTNNPFFMNSGNGVQFRAPVNGVTTSGSDYPRSELREMINNGDTQASWSSSTGTHTMTLDEAITAVPKTRQIVVAGQIHDGTSDVIQIRLDYPKLFIAVGKAYGAVTGPTLDANYTLGKRFTVKVAVTGGKTNVYYNGGTTPIYTLSKSYTTAYFKAGAYTQSNCTTDASDCSANNYGEVVVYDATVTHN